MSLLPPAPLKPGDPLTLDWLNRARAVGNSARIKVDPDTGLRLIVTPFLSILASVRPNDGWFLVTASLGSGKYTLAEQVEQASGTWSTGPRVVSAYEANLYASVPSSSTIRVWATFRRGQWRFVYSSCP